MARLGLQASFRVTKIISECWRGGGGAVGSGGDGVVVVMVVVVVGCQVL